MGGGYKAHHGLLLPWTTPASPASPGATQEWTGAGHSGRLVILDRDGSSLLGLGRSWSVLGLSCVGPGPRPPLPTTPIEGADPCPPLTRDRLVVLVHLLHLVEFFRFLRFPQRL